MINGEVKIMITNEKDLFKNSVSIESVCKNPLYIQTSENFNRTLSIIEEKLSERDKKLISELIYNRAVLETIVGEHMFKKGLNAKFKIKK